MHVIITLKKEKMKTLKISLTIFSLLISSFICPMQKKYKQQLNVDLNSFEYFTNKTFNALIQEQKALGKPYILAEAEINNKIFYYDAHEFNMYHFGYPISKEDLIDRQTGKEIKKIKYFICHKQKDGFKEFQSFDKNSCDKYYMNCNDPKVHIALASQENYGNGPGSLRSQYYLLAAQQNNDYDIKSKALENLIFYRSVDNDYIHKILQTTDINTLSNKAKVLVNYFLITTNFDKQDPQKQLERLKFCYDQEELPNTKRHVTEDFARLLYTVLDNSPKNIQLKINYLTEIYEVTKEPIQKKNLALRIAILYYLLETPKCLKEALKYLNKVINEEPTIDLNAKGLNYHDILTGIFYYAKIHLDGKVVPQNLDIAIKYFKAIRTWYNDIDGYKTPENEIFKRLAYFYLGKIKRETGFIIYFEYPDDIEYLFVEDYLHAALKNDLLPENLKIEAEELLKQIKEAEESDEYFYQENELKEQEMKNDLQIEKPLIKSPQKRKCSCENITCTIQ